MSYRATVAWVGGLAAANAAVIGGLFLAVPDNGVGVTPEPAPTATPTAAPTPADTRVPVTTQNIPAEPVSTKLVSLFPTPTNTLLTMNPVGVPGLPVDYQCPTTAVTPAVTKSATIAAGAGKGVSVQARAYPAGLGGTAIQAIRTQLQNCDSAYETTGARIGDESVTFTDNGSPAGGGNSGTTTVFRRGDMVGVVATRNYGDAEQLASAWNATWGKVLTKRVCPGQTSDPEDATRNPLSGDYRGWERTEKVTLDMEGQTAADAATVFTVRVNTPSGPRLDYGALPTKPGKTLTKNLDLTLPWYPDYLNVSLPPQPEVKPKPEFPTSPSDDAPATFAVADPIGPGCGWKFTGMIAPQYDEAKEAAKAEASRVTAAATLRASLTDWGIARWGYLEQYTAYAKSVAAQKAWVTAATTAIATAWWADYDEKRATYEQEYATWQAEYNQWKIDNAACEANQPTPEPTPTPTPTPTPSPGDPFASPTPTPTPTETYVPGPEPVNPCPPAPEPPAKPERPNLPRPA